MDERRTKVGELLHEAAETHHQVFRITDGADDDWASWYAQWLVTLSELPDVLGGAVVRSELTYMLVRLDKGVHRSPPGRALGGLLRPRAATPLQSRLTPDRLRAMGGVSTSCTVPE